MHLVLLETSGNQNFIFSTNKLRENFGASELTYRAGTQWVLEAIADISKKPTLWDENVETLRNNLQDPTLNPLVDENNLIEVVVAASGKALLLVKNRETAQQIVQQVTYRALCEAPGIDVCGVIESFESNEKIWTVNTRIHQKFEVVRAQRSGVEARFPRLPVVAIGTLV